MTTPETPSSPNKRDVLAKYAGRVFMLNSIDRPKISLDLLPDLTKSTLIPADLVEKCRAADADYTARSAGSTGLLELNYPLFKTILNKDSPGIVLEVIKQNRRYRGGQGNDWDRPIMTFLVREDNDQRGGLKFGEIGIEDSRSNNCWQMFHRLVWPEYRGPQNNTGETVGDILLAAAEQMMQRMADAEQNPYTLMLDTGQLDVMLWLERNGYMPRGDDNRERLHCVLEGDPDLCIMDNWYVFPWSGKPKVGTKDDAFRIRFAKKMPLSASQDVVSLDRQEIGKILKSSD